MSKEFAVALADVRLAQTAQLLEWMLQHAEADTEAVRDALGAVMDAHSRIKSLRGTAVAG
jgi:hypothetical protein